MEMSSELSNPFVFVANILVAETGYQQMNIHYLAIISVMKKYNAG